MVAERSDGSQRYNPFRETETILEHHRECYRLYVKYCIDKLEYDKWVAKDKAAEKVMQTILLHKLEYTCPFPVATIARVVKVYKHDTENSGDVYKVVVDRQAASAWTTDVCDAAYEKSLEQKNHVEQELKEKEEEKRCQETEWKESDMEHDREQETLRVYNLTSGVRYEQYQQYVDYKVQLQHEYKNLQESYQVYKQRYENVVNGNTPPRNEHHHHRHHHHRRPKLQKTTHPKNQERDATATLEFLHMHKTKYDMDHCHEKYVYATTTLKTLQDKIAVYEKKRAVFSGCRDTAYLKAESHRLSFLKVVDECRLLHQRVLDCTQEFSYFRNQRERLSLYNSIAHHNEQEIRATKITQGVAREKDKEKDKDKEEEEEKKEADMKEMKETKEMKSEEEEEVVDMQTLRCVDESKYNYFYMPGSSDFECSSSSSSSSSSSFDVKCSSSSSFSWTSSSWTSSSSSSSLLYSNKFAVLPRVDQLVVVVRVLNSHNLYLRPFLHKGEQYYPNVEIGDRVGVALPAMEWLEHPSMNCYGFNVKEVEQALYCAFTCPEPINVLVREYLSQLVLRPGLDVSTQIGLRVEPYMQLPASLPDPAYSKMCACVVCHRVPPSFSATLSC